MSPPASVLERGTSGPRDPQLGWRFDFPRVRGVVRRIDDGDTLLVGPVAIVARFTPGHTPGGTGRTWRSCDGARCFDIVSADSQPIAADDLRFPANTRYPAVITDFERSQRVLEGLRGDVLVIPHPGASGLWERVARMAAQETNALVDLKTCRACAKRAEAMPAERRAKERAAPQGERVDSPPDTPWHCPACGASVLTPFCGVCGEQRLSPDHRSLHHYLAAAAESMFSWDGRILGTLASFPPRPGEFALAHFERRQKPYLNPLQMFLLINVLFFLQQGITG